MKAEARELYVYTKDHFEADLNKISPTCVSPIIATRQVVNKAIDKYIKDYCTKETQKTDIFSHEDFTEVSNTLHDEIMNRNL